MVSNIIKKPLQQAKTISLNLQWARVVPLVTLWIVLNICLALFIKSLVTQPEKVFPFPITLCLVQQLPGFAVGCWWSVKDLMQGKENPMVEHRYTFICTSLCFSASICLGNVSLEFIHLSTAQMIKTLLPIFQVACSILLEQKTYSWKAMTTVPIVVCGAILGSYKAPDWNTIMGPVGYLLCAMGVVGTALYNSGSSILLQDKDLTRTQTWVYCSFYALLVMALPAIYGEFPSLFLSYDKRGPLTVMLYLLTSMVLAVGFCLCNFELMKITSSVYSAMLGIVKMVLTTIVSVIASPISFSPLRVCGFLTALLGFILFNHFAKRPAQQYQRLLNQPGVKGYSSITGNTAASQNLAAAGPVANPSISSNSTISV